MEAKISLCVLSHFQLFCNPMDCSQSPMSTGFSRQEYWSGLLQLFCNPWTVARLLCPQDFPGKNAGVGCEFLFPGDLPEPGIKPMSPVSLALQVDSLLLNH